MTRAAWLKKRRKQYQVCADAWLAVACSSALDTAAFTSDAEACRLLAHYASQARFFATCKTWTGAYDAGLVAANNEGVAQERFRS